MTTHFEGRFQVTSWTEEQSTDLEESLKVTVVRIGQQFSGGIEAETVADLVMTYLADGTAEFAGYQRISGLIGARTGSLVLRSAGRFEGGLATSHLEVVPESGRGDFVGVHGNGSSVAPSGSTGAYEFDFEFRD